MSLVIGKASEQFCVIGYGDKEIGVRTGIFPSVYFITFILGGRVRSARW